MLTKRRASEDFWSERLETQNFPCAGWHVRKATEEATVKLNTHKKSWAHSTLPDSMCTMWSSLTFPDAIRFFISKNFSFLFQKYKIYYKKTPYLNLIIYLIVGLAVFYFCFRFSIHFVWTLSCFNFQVVGLSFIFIKFRFLDWFGLYHV